MLGIFEHPLPSGDPLMELMQDDLLNTLHAFTPRNRTRQADLEGFLERAGKLLQQHLESVQANVDFLVDVNSYDQTLGESLAAEIVAADSRPLQSTMSSMLEHFGVAEEELATPGLLKIPRALFPPP